MFAGQRQERGRGVCRAKAGEKTRYLKGRGVCRTKAGEERKRCL